MSRKKGQSGCLGLFVTALLVVALIGCVIYLVFNYIGQKAESDAELYSKVSSAVSYSSKSSSSKSSRNSPAESSVKSSRSSSAESSAKSSRSSSAESVAQSTESSRYEEEPSESSRYEESSENSRYEEESSQSAVPRVPDFTAVKSGDEIVATVPIEQCFKYPQLNSTGKKIYTALLNRALTGGTAVTFKNVNVSEYHKAAKSAVTALCADHPELFWLSGGYWYTRYDYNDNYELELMCRDYWEYTSNGGKYIDALEQKVARIADEAEKLSSDYERVKFVYDYIIANADYDTRAAAQANKTLRTAAVDQAYSAYGCLVNGKCVCAGYAKAFQLIMGRLGIRCDYVTGNAGGELHAWNMIELENGCCYLDVTWDDPIMSDGSTEYNAAPRYKYFCVTKKEISKTHTADTTLFTYPPCVTEEYSYFTRNGYTMGEFNELAALEMIGKQFEDGQKIIYIKFDTEAHLKAAAKSYDLWEVVYDVTGKPDNSITYWDDTEFLILNIYL